VTFYDYKGLDTKGKPVQGVEKAENAQALLRVLKTKGIFLTEATVTCESKGTHK
jgi:type II secretory pathway component PulF